MSGDTLLLANLCSTMFLAGLAWFLQLVHIPLMQRASRLEFTAFARMQRSRNTALMAPVMVIEAASGIGLWYHTPQGVSGAKIFWGAVLIIVIWIVTLFRIIPLHSRLMDGYDDAAIGSLSRGNWIRTLCWTVRATLIIMIFAARGHAS